MKSTAIGDYWDRPIHGPWELSWGWAQARTLSCRSMPGCVTIVAGAQASPSRTAPFSGEGVRPYQDHFLHNNFPQGQQLGSFPAGPESRSANTQEMGSEPLQILLSPQNFTQTPTFRYPCLSCVSVFPLWSIVS